MQFIMFQLETVVSPYENQRKGSRTIVPGLEAIALTVRVTIFKRLTDLSVQGSEKNRAILFQYPHLNGLTFFAGY